MKKVRNLLVMVMCVLLLSTLPVRNVSATEAEEYSDVTIEVLSNGWTKYTYTDAENSLARAQGKGYNKYIRYSDTAGTVVCEYKVTVGFNYGYDDGIVRITSLNYSKTYVKDGFSLVFTGSSKKNGSPAVASVTCLIYFNSSIYTNDTTYIKCYTNGNVVVD